MAASRTVFLIWRDVLGNGDQIKYTPRDGIVAVTAHLPRIGRSRSDVQGTCFPVPSFFLS